MKSILIAVVFILLLSFLTQAEKLDNGYLTLKQLTLLLDKDTEGINDFLLERSWVYKGISETVRNDSGDILYFKGIYWAFGFNKNTGKANSWLKTQMRGDDDTKLSRIEYQCPQEHFSTIKNEVLSLGLKRTYSGTSLDGSRLISDYKNEKIKIRFIVLDGGQPSIVIERAGKYN